MDTWDEIPRPVFDYVKEVGVGAEIKDMVVHMQPDMHVAAFHSPLTNGAITCAICASGVKVWILPR